jgi:hypothetical protein
MERRFLLANWRRRRGAKRTVRLAERNSLIVVQRRPRSGKKHLTSIIRAE